LVIDKQDDMNMEPHKREVDIVNRMNEWPSIEMPLDWNLILEAVMNLLNEVVGSFPGVLGFHDKDLQDDAF